MRSSLNAFCRWIGVMAILLPAVLLLPVERLQPKACAQPFIMPTGGSDTTACLPDCFNSPFSAPKLYKINIPPNGWFLVKYRTRHACNVWWDVYIDWIIPLNASTDPFASYSMQYILEKVTKFLLIENPMQFPPFPTNPPLPPPPCVTNWRVIKGPCWSRVNTGNPTCPIQYISCNEALCCLEPYRVCVDPSTRLRTVQKMSYGWAPYGCPYTPPGNGAPCEPACGYPPQYNE